MILQSSQLNVDNNSHEENLYFTHNKLGETEALIKLDSRARESSVGLLSLNTTNLNMKLPIPIVSAKSRPRLAKSHYQLPKLFECKIDERPTARHHL